MRRQIALASAASAAVLFMPLAATAGGPATSLAAEPINAVILADESGSLTASGVASERDAANALVTSDLSPDSRFTIIGFGSDNGQPGQNAVTDYCAFIQVSSAKARDALARCADRIHARTEAEGNDTDQATAIQHAVDELKSQPKAGASVIFILTDGVLDVHRSPAFGSTASRRTAEALRRLNQQFLPAAKAAGIQIWPLGFGPSVSSSSLQNFAAGGAGANALCLGTSGAAPHAIVVSSNGDVIHSLELALGRARCGDIGPTSSAQLPNGGSKTLTINIPLIATDGSLIVTKGQPSFNVSFTDPEGDTVPPSGTFKGQQFFLSGQNSRVESLRIVNPLPGNWKVAVSDPQHVSQNQTISAFATWQGTLQASLILDPALPKPGDKVNMELRVLSREGVVSEKILRSAQASATGSVTTAAGTVPVKLADDGKGVFRGAFILPSNAKGDVTVKARVSGAGLAADQRIVSFAVQMNNFVSATVNMKSPSSVVPGGTISGTVSVINQGPQRTGTVRLTGLNGKTLLTINKPTGAQPVPNGSSSIPFTLKVPSDSPEGALDGQVQFVSGGQVIGQSYIATNVEKPKGFLEKNSWLIPLVIVIVLLALLAVLARLLLVRNRRQQESDVSSLIAYVKKGDKSQHVSDIPWDHIESKLDKSEFAFSIVPKDDDVKLEPANHGGQQVVVRRSGQTLTVKIDDEEHTVSVGEQIDLGAGVALSFEPAKQWSDPDDPGDPSRAQGPAIPGIGDAADDPPTSGSKYGN